MRKAIIYEQFWQPVRSLRVGSKEYEIYRLKALDEKGISTRHLPYSLRILLENLLRTVRRAQCDCGRHQGPGRME